MTSEESATSAKASVTAEQRRGKEGCGGGEEGEEEEAMEEGQSSDARTSPQSRGQQCHYCLWKEP